MRVAVEEIQELQEIEDEAPLPRPGPGLSLVGTILADRYQIIERIAEGGMGTVYLAEHITIHRRLAVKVLSPDLGNSPDIAQRFLREAQASSMIQHEHIVDIIDFGYTERGQAFLAMELLEGEDLATTLEREGRLPWTRLRRMVLQMCRALHAAHDKGVVHRDMKPDNCFRIKRGGNADFIKLLDFGIAKVMTEATTFRGKKPVAQATAAGTLLGTPEYMAPELARDGVPDARVDIYSLGVMMYELLTGSVPLRGETFMATIALHLTQEPIPPRQRAPSADIPPAIEAVVMRALAKEPDDRFQNIREMTEALVAADQRLRSTGLFLPAVPDTPETTPTIHDEADEETEVERAPTLNVSLQSSPSLRTQTPKPVDSGRQALVDSSSEREALGLQTTLDPAEVSIEQAGVTDSLEQYVQSIEHSRPNPYRWLSAILALVVLGLGFMVWQFTRGDTPETVDPALAGEATPGDSSAVSGADSAASVSPVAPVAKAVDSSAEEEPEGESESEGIVTDPRFGTMQAITEDERLQVAGDLQRAIKKCAKGHGIRPQDQGKVTVSLRVKVGTGKISADIPSEVIGTLMGTCILEAVNGTQFQPGRKAMRFNHIFGP